MEWADLISTVRKTRGDVPPPLVGASTTLIGDTLFVFGGRPVSSREMVNSLYALDLRTLTWSLLSLPDAPAPRYFHSAECWMGHKIVFFGGQSFIPPTASSSSSPIGAEGAGEVGSLETLDELVVFDTVQRRWSYPQPTVASGATRPSPRYAHLSLVSTQTSAAPLAQFSSPSASSPASSISSRLLIVGGQDYDNQYLTDLSVLDLDRMEWVSNAPYPRKAGTYRSVAAAAAMSVRPREERMGPDGQTVHSSYGVAPSEEAPEPALVFSNTNFSNPRRDLDLIASLHEGLTTPAYVSLSDSMVGDPSFPPGLRFPRAYICGNHLVLSGSHVGVNRASFELWSLDFGEKGEKGKGPMRWSRIDVDKVFGKGSWGPALGWRNTLVVLGDGMRDAMEDYNSRQTNFGSVAFVQLEGFGIYTPPPQALPPTQQTLGLLSFSQPQMYDYELLCSDKERLGCSRRLLEARWDWFRDELAAVEHKKAAAVEAREQWTTGEVRGAYSDESSDDEPIDTMQRRAGGVTSPVPSSSRPAAPAAAGMRRAPSRIFPVTSHTLELPLSSTDARALLAYFATLSLSTPAQRSVPVLASLLAFTRTYETVLPALRALVVHALHESLNSETAAKVYEAAVLGECVALQIRAMQVMLAARRPSAPTEAQSTLLHPARYSDQSQTSSAGSSTDSHLGLPYDRSSSSSYLSTPSSSVHSWPSSPLPTAPPTTVPPLPPLPTHYNSAPPPLPSSPLPPLPVFANAPVYGSASRGPDGRASSLSAASDISNYAPSSHSGHSSPAPVSPAVSAYPAPPRSTASSPLPPSMPIAATTPARIAEAWREGEERDQRQRAEAARLAAESDVNRGFAGLRLGGIGERKGSLAPSTLSSISERNGVPASSYAFAPTPSVAGLTSPRESDTDSVRTSSSSGANSTATRQSAEKAAAVAGSAAIATAKVVKKGFLGGLLAQPTMHNAGTKGAPAATGPPPRKVYPAPRTRKEVEAAKKAAKEAAKSDGGSSRGSVRS